ncbi:MAG: branched-chain-amino-acid transaminase [Acetobacteraceae bacterium]|nr:branched-chain-amino-acid transaminase [Acetobacteraceae bacterium]
MWKPRIIVQNGRSIPFDEARIHPLSVGTAYGIGVFEGLRAYYNAATGRLSVFRLEEHLTRLEQGMKIMRFDDPPSREVLREGVLRVVRENEPDDDAYIRLQVHIEALGMMATTGPVGWVAGAMPRERSPKFRTGLSVGVSSWTRIADDAMPPRVKATANYHAARLATLQAKADGYDTAILLTQQGKVSEAPSACLFIVRNGRLITPARSSDILESVTRDTVLVLADELGIPVREETVDRTELYVADEMFLCGTGQELVPVTQVDRLPVGNGQPGPLTMRLQAAYEAVVRGTTDAHPEWRTPVT